MPTRTTEQPWVDGHYNHISGSVTYFIHKYKYFLRFKKKKNMTKSGEEI